MGSRLKKAVRIGACSCRPPAGALSYGKPKFSGGILMGNKKKLKYNVQHLFR
jgi:hypothetical protein